MAILKVSFIQRLHYTVYTVSDTLANFESLYSALQCDLLVAKMAFGGRNLSKHVMIVNVFLGLVCEEVKFRLQSRYLLQRLDEGTGLLPLLQLQERLAGGLQLHGSVQHLNHLVREGMR